MVGLPLQDPSAEPRLYNVRAPPPCRVTCCKNVIQRTSPFLLRINANAFGAVCKQFSERICSVADGIDAGNLGDTDENKLPLGKPTINSNGLSENLHDVFVAASGKMSDFNSAFKHLSEGKSVTIGVGADYSVIGTGGETTAYQQKMIFSPQLAR